MFGGLVGMGFALIHKKESISGVRPRGFLDPIHVPSKLNSVAVRLF